LTIPNFKVIISSEDAMDRKMLGRRLRQAREAAGLSQEEAAKRLGKSQSAMSDYERGRLGLELPDLVELAKVLDQPVSFFLDEQANNVQHRTEQELRRARQVIEAALEGQVRPPRGEVVRWVPLVAGGSAGDVVETWELEQVPVPLSLVSNKDVFALEVLGRSMRGRGIQDGDRVIVDPNRSPRDGEIVVARRNSEKVIRIYHEDEDGPYLAAAARGYPRLRLKEATIVGVVTGWFRHPGKR